MKRLLIALVGAAAMCALAAGVAGATATTFLIPVQATLPCGTETVDVSGYFRAVAAESNGATIFHVTADEISGTGSSGTQYRLVGAGSDIEAGLGATTITSFHHGTLVGGTGMPIHPLFYVFHATLTPSGKVSSVSIDVGDCF